MLKNRKQLLVFSALLATTAALAFLALALGLQDQLIPESDSAPPLPSWPPWLLGVANGVFILILYGLFGLAGLWFADRLDLPGAYREGAGWFQWVVLPAGLGAAVGVVMVLVDRLAAATGGWSGFPHPPFPLSLIASGTAGIGEEIVFRMFVMGLWAYLFSLALKRWRKKDWALWGGNVIAALAFGAGHLPATMMLLNVSSPAHIPPLVLAELFFLNGLVGLVAGERYMRQGLVAAAGVHFWADIVWHVLYG